MNTMHISPCVPTRPKPKTEITSQYNAPRENINNDEVRQFITDWLNSKSDDRLTRDIGYFYANNVDYYSNGVISRDKVVAFIGDFALRWPIRKYILKGRLIITMVSHFLDSCLRRNDTDGRKIPFLVIPVKTGIHFQKPHKKPVNKKVQKYR